MFTCVFTLLGFCLAPIHLVIGVGLLLVGLGVFIFTLNNSDTTTSSSTEIQLTIPDEEADTSGDSESDSEVQDEEEEPVAEDEDVVEEQTDSLFDDQVTFRVEWHTNTADKILIRNNSAVKVTVNFFDQDVDDSALPDSIVLDPGEDDEFILEHMPSSFSASVDLDEEFQADFERP